MLTGIIFAYTPKNIDDRCYFFRFLEDAELKRISQEHIMSMIFKNSINREELLIKKYTNYNTGIKDKEIGNMLNEFKKNSREHIKLIKDKMIKLNIQD